MRRSSRSDASAEACGTPALRCSDTGRKGCGRGDCGQASSVRPVTHSASKSMPTDSSRPSTCTGASPDSGWKTVSAHDWRRWRLADSPVSCSRHHPERGQARPAPRATSRAPGVPPNRGRARPGIPPPTRHAAKCAAHSCGVADASGRREGRERREARLRAPGNAAPASVLPPAVTFAHQLAQSARSSSGGAIRRSAASRRARSASSACASPRKASATRGSRARTGPAPPRGRAAPGRRRRAGSPPGACPATC